MKFDIFFSICQTDVDGTLPNERTMFENFFDQVKLADSLGFGTAWVAETHLSCQVQKQNPGAVIPHFKGEIGLNTDILQLAHKVFSCTEQIHVGSAIMNIICNGGPIAHAEAIKTFLSLHGLDPEEKRCIEVGFAAGRFPFTNAPYGYQPRDAFERQSWQQVKSIWFREATEIFLRALGDEAFSSEDIATYCVSRQHYRNDDDWHQAVAAYNDCYGTIEPNDNDTQLAVNPFWSFEKIGVIPYESRQDLLKLTIGSHDPETQIHANRFRPVGVFNLSITPSDTIEHTHELMQEHYHKDSGPWRRDLMPRTALVFVNGDKALSPEKQSAAATDAARRALANYWSAMEGTLDRAKVENAVENAIAGNPRQVADAIKEKYHADDRLMLWFDFNNHDNEQIKASMRAFMDDVRPLL